MKTIYCNGCRIRLMDRHDKHIIHNYTWLCTECAKKELKPVSANG